MQKKMNILQPCNNIQSAVEFLNYDLRKSDMHVSVSNSKPKIGASSSFSQQHIRVIRCFRSKPIEKMLDGDICTGSP
jgi:hypothetical protein